MKDKIKSAIFNEFGREPGKVEKAAEGLKHETYFVEVDGEEYVLQFLGEEREDHNALSHCLDCYRLLEDVVPVPSIVTPEPRKVEGHEYTVVEKLPGGNAELEITPEKVFNAGRTLARIHDYMEFEEAGWISFEDEVTVYPFEEGSLKRKIISDLEEKTEVYRKEGMKEVAAVVQKFIDSKIGGLPEKFVPVICHDDFSPDNRKSVV